MNLFSFSSTDSQLKLWSLTNKPHCLRTFRGHINEKNFVGLASDGDYIACGSENNSLCVYFKGLSKQFLNFKFDTVRSVLVSVISLCQISEELRLCFWCKAPIWFKLGVDENFASVDTFLWYYIWSFSYDWFCQDFLCKKSLYLNQEWLSSECKEDEPCTLILFHMIFEQTGYLMRCSHTVRWEVSAHDSVLTSTPSA
jgi:WD40 repeat protein